MSASTDHSTDRDVLDLLMTDHREVEELLQQLLSTSDGGQRRDLADQLVAELVRHSVAEEMHVYPVMRDRLPGGQQAVDHDTSEHKELEALMKQLESADASSAAFTDVVRKIAAALQDHVSDEEQEQFPKLRQAVPAEELVALKEKVETAKRLAPTRPHPLSPNAELFHKTVGAGVGLVDRLRDKISGRST